MTSPATPMPSPHELDGSPIPVLIEYMRHDHPPLRADATFAFNCPNKPPSDAVGCTTNRPFKSIAASSGNS